MKTAICALLFILIASHVSAKSHSFNFNDIAKGTGAVKIVKRTVKVTGSRKILGGKAQAKTVVKTAYVPAPPPPPGSTNGKQFLVLAQAKIGSNTHPSIPYIIVDAQATVPGCKGLDYLFFSHCKATAPKTDLKLKLFNFARLSHSFIYIFELPVGYKNVRIGFPSFGTCGLRRIGKSIVSPRDQCMSAPFRRRERYRPCVTKRIRKKVCKRVCVRRCKQKSFLGIKGKKRCTTTCTNPCTWQWVTVPCPYTWRWRDCDFSHFAVRVLSATTQSALKLLPNKGSKYGSFTLCSVHEAARLFLAD